MSLNSRFRDARRKIVLLEGGFAVYLRPPNTILALTNNPITPETYQAVKREEVEKGLGADLLKAKYNDMYCWTLSYINYCVIAPPEDVLADEEFAGRDWIHRIVLDPSEQLGPNDVFHENLAERDIDHIGDAIWEMLSINRKEAESIAPFHGTGNDRSKRIADGLPS